MNNNPTSELPEEPSESAPWIGYYTYRGHFGDDKHGMRMDLVVAETRIYGAGTDDVGPFEVEGRIPARSDVVLRKRYIGRHTVRYHGFLEEGYGIWGRWLWSGDKPGGEFHIWPGPEPGGEIGEHRFDHSTNSTRI